MYLNHMFSDESTIEICHDVENVTGVTPLERMC